MFYRHDRKDRTGLSSVASRRSSEDCPSVLYIDDDWGHLLYQRFLLESAGYNVEATDSPAAALSSYVRSSYDAVILDYHLPFVSGGLLATFMRVFRHDIPLILIADPNESVEAESGSWDRQFPEDLPPALFLANVSDAIERAHNQPGNR